MLLGIFSGPRARLTRVKSALIAIDLHVYIGVATRPQTTLLEIHTLGQVVYAVLTAGGDVLVIILSKLVVVEVASLA